VPRRAQRKLPSSEIGLASVLKNLLSIHVLGFAAIAFVSSKCVQAADYKISAARAAVTHKCSVLAAKYPEYAWGNREIFEYLTCMVNDGQKP
jgi:hypothetical protein